MPESFLKDLEYLAKVTLLTFIILSVAVIYKQKVLEGIILLTFCIQIILLWFLIKNYELSESLPLLYKRSSLENFNRYLYFVGLLILFLLAIIFLFRALAIAQHSILNYGSIKAAYNFEIILTSTLGSIFFLLFIIVFYLRYKALKKNDLAASPSYSQYS